MLVTTKVRVARPTDNLEEITKFYRDAPTLDNLLVFYIPDERQWSHAVARLKRSGCEPVASFNPYWDRSGVTFEDPDGYRVVLQRAVWDL